MRAVEEHQVSDFWANLLGYAGVTPIIGLLILGWTTRLAATESYPGLQLRRFDLEFSWRHSLGIRHQWHRFDEKSGAKRGPQSVGLGCISLSPGDYLVGSDIWIAVVLFLRAPHILGRQATTLVPAASAQAHSGIKPGIDGVFTSGYDLKTNTVRKPTSPCC